MSSGAVLTNPPPLRLGTNNRTTKSSNQNFAIELASHWRRFVFCALCLKISERVEGPFSYHFAKVFVVNHPILESRRLHNQSAHLLA